MSASALPCANGRIGPNAIIRAAEALTALESPSLTTAVFRQAGIERYLAGPPEHLVPEAEVAALHIATHAALGTARARSAGWIAGQRTAAYLLANRIPQPVRRLLRRLPPRLAARLLLRAIRRHAWTFIGTGTLRIAHGNPTVVTVHDCPLCRGLTAGEPACDFYAAAFERLFASLVHANARAVETDCAAAGAPACRFEIAW